MTDNEVRDALWADMDTWSDAELENLARGLGIPLSGQLGSSRKRKIESEPLVSKKKNEGK
jgi:hypothetical protein